MFAMNIYNWSREYGCLHPYNDKDKLRKGVRNIKSCNISKLSFSKCESFSDLYTKFVCLEIPKTTLYVCGNVIQIYYDYNRVLSCEHFKKTRNLK